MLIYKLKITKILLFNNIYHTLKIILFLTKNNIKII